MDKNKEEMQKYYNDLFEHGGRRKISNIPDEYKTEDMCNEYIKKGGNLKDVPVNLMTQEMCDKYKKNSDFDIKAVPDQFITEEMCNKHLKNEGDISDIPTRFITEELCGMYIELRLNNFQKIPENYLTQELCDKYMKRKFAEIKYVPEKFVTQEMVDEYMKRSSSDLMDIPEKFRTYDMYIDYIKRGGLLSKVPNEYLNEKMYIAYVKSSRSLDEIPNEFKNQNLYDAYISAGGDIDNVPEEYRNKKWHEKFIEEDFPEMNNGVYNELNLKKVYFFLLKVYNKVKENKELSFNEIAILVNLKENPEYEEEVNDNFKLKDLFDKIMATRDYDMDFATVTNAPEEYLKGNHLSDLKYEEDFKKLNEEMENSSIIKSGEEIAKNYINPNHKDVDSELFEVTNRDIFYDTDASSIESLLADYAHHKKRK